MELKLKNCVVCNTIFEANTSGKYCSPECATQKFNEKYRTKKVLKNCNICGNEFYGTGHERNCSNCKGKAQWVYVKIEQPILCKRCGGYIETVIKSKVGKTKPTLKARVCADCRELSLKRISERMKTDSNPSVMRYGRNTYVPLTKEQVSKIQRDKMLGDKNPMKRAEVKEKVRLSLQKRYETQPPIVGAKRKNWRGRRIRNQTIRTRLYYSWILPILKLDGFMCAFCRKTGRLEVHHVTRSFINIVKEVLNGKDINKLSNEEFEDVIIKVIEIHKDIQGVSLCVACHKLFDSCRH